MNKVEKIRTELMNIYDNFEPYSEVSPDGKEVTEVSEPNMYWLVTQYTRSGLNKDKVGGSWVRKNIHELADIPS